jgi:signal transduction histidine kinase
MAVSWLAIYRAVLLSTIVIGLFVFYQANKHREKPGARPLALLVFGGLLYVGVKLAISAVRGTPTVFIITRFNPLAAGLATAGFFLLVVEYTGIENPISRRTAGLLLIEPVVVSSLVWFDIEYLWVPAGPDPSTLTGYAWEMTSIAIANQLYMNILLILGIVLLGRFVIQSATVFKRQTTALLLAAVGPVLGNLAFYVGAVPFNLTPVMFVLSAILITWAIFWSGFLDLVPIGRNAVVSDLNAGVMTVDGDHRVIDTNECSYRVFDLDDTDSVVGRHIDELFADLPSFREQYWSIIDRDTDHVSRVEFEGRYFTLEAIPLETSAERTVGHTVVIRDVTDQALREQELEQKNEQLERFASVISHDIRNPLNVIQGHAEFARHNDPEPHLDTIAENADRIENIIEDALVMTRSEGIQETEPVNISTVARRAWGHIETNDVRLKTDCDFSLEGDPARLVQLFENVFRNAIEHGGDVELIEVGTLPGENGNIRGFFVADDGVGIPEENRETVMEDGYTTSEDGTGLGLSIISDVVETHDWRMEITESETGGARIEIERQNQRLKRSLTSPKDSGSIGCGRSAVR